MDQRIVEIAQRIREMRELLEITPEEMAQATGVSVEGYGRLESGESDFTFTFLYKCAKVFDIDIVEILTGDIPKLRSFSVVRKDKGLPIARRSGFKYQHMAYLFKDKVCEPFIVTAPYSEEDQNKPISMSMHKGQEFDFILQGTLKMEVDGHTVELHEGDMIYYDSAKPHGMIATGGEDCVFLAVVLQEQGGAEK